KADNRETPVTDGYGFMQFMVDAVVLFQHRLTDRVSLRTLRVLKYRGTGFSENEYPLVISGERLDTMLAGGYYAGSGVLITGVPGTSKTTLAAACVDATCARGDRALYVSF